MPSLLALWLLAIVWASLLITPHFQSDASLRLLLYGLVLSAIGFFAALKAFPKAISIQLSRIYFVVVVGISMLIILAHVGISLPYLLFSRLGSYSMFDDGKLVLFGDMTHLTSAASCKLPIEIGATLCDPWDRSFNQNPDVAKFLDLVGATNHILLGLLAFLFLVVSMYLLLQKYSPTNPLVWLMSLTPPMILAIDRGTETLTIALICISIYLSKVFPRNSVFYLPLIIAGIFKIWPFAVFFLMMAMSKPRKLHMFLLLSLPVGAYILIRTSEFKKISIFTQEGSLLGGSFGWRLLDFPGAYSVGVLIMSLLVTGLILKYLPLNLLSQNNYRRDKSWIVSLSITYIFLNFSGSHFIYRLIILIPIAILLQVKDESRPLQVLIFISLLTSRMSIVLVITLAIALILLILISVDIMNNLRQHLKSLKD